MADLENTANLEITHLEVLSDDESEYSDDIDVCGDVCYYCDVELEYECNEFYDEEADRFYCKRCWEQIHE